MINGGPFLFKLPLFVLSCMQSILTESFLKLGFAKSAPKDLLEQARIDSNANSMFVCQCLYQSHDWVTSATLNEVLLRRRVIQNDDNDRGDVPDALPRLVIHGIEDQIIPISSSQHIANALETDLVSVENASHLVIAEQPVLVSESIYQFILSTISA